MGLWSKARKVRSDARGAGDAPAIAWHERALLAARAHGAMPYVVEGFAEVSEAVRRGHAVLLLREACEVADGVHVFAEEPGAGPGGGLTGSIAVRSTPTDAASTPMVTVLRFDASSARFVLRDAHGAAGGTQLTPRRLETYLQDDRRSVGVALGAA